MGQLHEVEIHRLRPTQITVGLIEVHDKRAKLEALKKHEQRDFLEAHPIPGVWGPDDKVYIIDHHHLGRAACEAGVDTGFFCIEGDFSKVPVAQFWPKMNDVKWTHPVDQNGRLRPFTDIPNHLEKLQDDPTALWRGTCAMPAATIKRRPRSPNSCGRISSGRAW